MDGGGVVRWKLMELTQGPALACFCCQGAVYVLGGDNSLRTAVLFLCIACFSCLLAISNSGLGGASIGSFERQSATWEAID